MITHLKERSHYENRYDELTVSLCRRQEDVVASAFRSAKAKGLPKLTGKDKDKDPEREMMKVFNWLYYFHVDWTAGERWQKRNEEIQKMMDKDEAKDRQLIEARLREEPVCTHCGKTGRLRIISKDLMHRGHDYKYDDPEEVLIMLECPSCKKRSAYWEDGTVWERTKTLCPKCQSEMAYKSIERGKVLTTTYTCTNCKHPYKDKYEFGKYNSDNKPDPDFEKDKARFCLSDKDGNKYLEGRRNLESLRDVLSQMKEKQDNKHIYDAVGELKKPKIAELSELLAPALEKAGYIEFSLDKPEMGRDVFIGFNCLDSKSEREDYDSRKTLKKLVEKTLEDTNWRLMSDGISYRLGYLNGRLRAYEREEDLKELVIKSKKLKAKQRSSDATSKKNARTIKDKDGNDIIL